MDKKTTFTNIRTLPPFKKLNDEEVRAIAQIAYEKTFSIGDVLIQQGDISADVFIITSGCVKVYRTAESGTVINLAVVGSNEIVGEMSLFGDKSRSATVEALQETRVIVLNHTDFERIVNTHSRVGVCVLKTIIKHLYASNSKLEELVSQKLTFRVWKALEILSQYYQQGEVTLSQEELADITGATRSRVTESLHKLQLEGKITLSRRSIRLTHPLKRIENDCTRS